jgi:hypothetical protein
VLAEMYREARSRLGDPVAGRRWRSQGRRDGAGNRAWSIRLQAATATAPPSTNPAYSGRRGCGHAGAARPDPGWTAGDKFGGHDSPKFAPNLVALLFDHGVEAGDDPRIGHLLDQMVDHQVADGRFQSYASERSSEPPVWGSAAV